MDAGELMQFLEVVWMFEPLRMHTPRNESIHNLISQTLPALLAPPASSTGAPQTAICLAPRVLAP